MQHKFVTYLTDLEVTVIAHLSPSVPPRIRMDPNDSDPGDPGERYVEAVLLRRTGQPDLNIINYFDEGQLEDLAKEAWEDDQG